MNLHDRSEGHSWSGSRSPGLRFWEYEILGVRSVGPFRNYHESIKVSPSSCPRDLARLAEQPNIMMSAEQPEAEGTHRCWICLEDAETLEGMISPCACVGTNRWVHEDCAQCTAEIHKPDTLRVALPLISSWSHCTLCRPQDILPPISRLQRRKLAFAASRMPHLPNRVPDHRAAWQLLRQLARAASVE
jgi:hypothetical protein